MCFRVLTRALHRTKALTVGLERFTEELTDGDSKALATLRRTFEMKEQMPIDQSTLSQHVRQLCADYSTMFPDEAHRCAALLSQLDSETGDIGSRKNMQGHVTASALAVNETFDKVLLIHHKIYDLWLYPGGHYEGDLTLHDAAARELLEETGVQGHEPPGKLEPLASIPLDIDSHPIAANAKKDEGAHQHHDLLFVFVASSSEGLEPQLAEVNSAKWLAMKDIPEQSARLQRAVKKLQQFRSS